MDNHTSNQNDNYSLPLAIMTFGKEQINDFTFNNNLNSNNNTLKSEINNNLTLKNNQNIFKEIPPETKNESLNGKEEYENDKNKKKYSFLSTFSCKINSHNSFIIPILYSIYYMKLIRNYIINEAKIPNNNNSILYHIKKILILISENKKIDLSQFRNCLAENFQNRRKFLIDHPDDPLDLYFVIINSIHSNFLQLPEKEISDYSCREKCCSHHYLWMDIARIDFCDCGGNNKRLFSNHNYIFDIPIDKIFNLCKNYILINNDINNVNGIKVKERNSQSNFCLYDFYGKLFYYYKFLMNNINIDCPVNGIRCNINKTHMKLIINNNPNYLVFYLNQCLNFGIYDILKNFLLIPKTFDINTLFDIPNFNGKNINEYSFNLFGCVLLKSSKTFSGFFKDIESYSWIYYDDDYIINFNNLYEVIIYCLKNSLIPYMLFYKGNMNQNNNNMYDTINDNITSEQFNILEKYALNTDSLSKFLENKIRIKEDFLGNYNNFSYNKNSLTNSSNDSVLNNNNNNINKNEFYNCYNCQNKNKINENNCVKCGKNNINLISENLTNRKNDIKNNKHNNIHKINIINNINLTNNSINNNSNNSNISNSNNNKNKKNKQQKKNHLNHLNIIPISVGNNKINSNIRQTISNNKKKKNIKIEEDDDTIDSQLKKNLDMPKPYIPKKDIPIKLKTNINNINSLQLSSKNKKSISPKKPINYSHTNTNQNKLIQSQNAYLSQALKKRQKENIKTISTSKSNNNEIEERIISYENALKKRPNTTTKISYAEIKNYNQRYNQELNNFNYNNNNYNNDNNMKLSTNISNNYSNENWYCPNCRSINKGNNRCRNCNYNKKNDNNSLIKHSTTPKNSHKKLFEKRSINNNFDRKYSERNTRGQINDKKVLRKSHSKSPNGLYFISGNNNKPINNNISNSNVNVNLGMKNSETNQNNFKRKK